MDENKKVINSNTISMLFGLYSEFFKEYRDEMGSQGISYSKQFTDKYKKWRETFEGIYGKHLNKELFIKHSYYAYLLELFLTNIFNDFDLPDFKLYYQEYSKDFSLKVIKILKNYALAREDLFQDLYQEMIHSTTRHRIGEFYTPYKLVNAMLNDVYKNGLKVLDPSCGSGNFLVEICLRVLDSNETDSIKSNAINNVYGFDINPLAVLTAKVNILLIFAQYFGTDAGKFPEINIYVMDSLFPEKFESKFKFLISLYNQFDLIIGNPPWLTYKDIYEKLYQSEILKLADKYSIKPSSQYITHIELAAIFFYAIPNLFLLQGGTIFFVITKSVLNGDHCHKFRSFSQFSDIEIWDTPNNYHFNVNHICLKATFKGITENFHIESNYPITARILNENYEIQDTTTYSSLEINNEGAKIILPMSHLNIIENVRESEYKNKFYQGATLVPRSLVFFQIISKQGNNLVISSDNEILQRVKQNWKYFFKNKIIESQFGYTTFLNLDLVPFYIKKFRHVFLPINEHLEYNPEDLMKFPYANKFYREVDEKYKKNKKESSKILELFSNLNYWNKLTKQGKNKKFVVVYNASGSNLKSAVIENDEKKVIIGSENYYFSTNSQNEAYYLSAVFNSPIFTRYIKMIKSSRHIHKRPFTFPIPIYDGNNEIHRSLAKKAQKYHSIVQDLVSNNPKITPEKVRVFIHKKLVKLDDMTKSIVFKN